MRKKAVRKNKCVRLTFSLCDMDGQNGFVNHSSSSDEILKAQYPLHFACRDGDIETMSRLLADGDIDLYEEDAFFGWTPVHWAAHYGKLACLRKLSSVCSDGVLFDHATSLGQTPLHLASNMGHPHCAQWLVLTGANIEKKDYLGETPFHKAARSGSMECVSLLISQGCSTCVKNNNNQIPSQLAAQCGHNECALYINSAGEASNSSSVHQLQQQQSHTTMQATNGVFIPNSSGDTDMDDSEMETCDNAAAEGSTFTGCRKRALDEEKEESKKRMKHGENERSVENNILRSYHAILSISTEPLQTRDASNLNQQFNDHQSVFV